VVAQVLKGCDGLPSLSVPPSSHKHDCDFLINCEKFFKFLQDEIPLTLLQQLPTNPAIVLNQNVIDQILMRCTAM
jgi:hypothetical protein